MIMIKPRLYDEKSAATYLSLSRAYLTHARSKGKSASGASAPSFIKIGGSIRYPIEELDKFIDSFPLLDNLSFKSDKID